MNDHVPQVTLPHGEAVTDTSIHASLHRLYQALVLCGRMLNASEPGNGRTLQNWWQQIKHMGTLERSGTTHYSVVNESFSFSLDSLESAPEMDSHHGNTARLGKTTGFGLQLFSISMWQKLHMWLKYARWPKTRTILNTLTPLLPCKATEHQACSKHGTESPWMWVSDSKIEYLVKEISSSVCVANWFVLLSDTHFPGSFK